MVDIQMRPDYGAMQLAIFRGEDPGGVLWQPRLDWWYKVNKSGGSMPDHLKDASFLEICDYCHASCRYFMWDRSWLRGNSWLKVRQKTVEVSMDWTDPQTLRRTWHTPIGDLSQVIEFDEWQVSSHITEYRVKGPEDFKILRYILEDEEWFWDDELFQQDLAKYKAYGTPQFYFRRSPYQRLMIEDMGLQQTIYFMYDYPNILEEYMEFATAADDVMYDVICKCPVEIINLGENVDGFIDSPKIWKEKLVPYYAMRTDQLHAAGKFVSVHIDGTMKSLLPHLRDFDYDAIEAPTAEPQGDVTIEQIRDAVGDLIVMDGIPSLLVNENQYPVEQMFEFTQKMVDYFYPRLVLGVSDEVPPGADIERIRMIGEFVKGLV